MTFSKDRTMVLRHRVWRNRIACLIFGAALCLLHGGIASVYAAIEIDGVATSAGESNNVTVTSLTWNHTVGNGLNRVLIVGVSTYTDAGNPVARVDKVTYGGAELTPIGSSIEPVNPSSLPGFRSAVEMFILIAPPSGQASIVVTFNAVVNQAVGGAVTFSGVNQCTPIRVFTPASGLTGDPTVIVPSASGELVIDTVATSPGAIFLSPSLGQTQQWNGIPFFSNQYSVGAGSTKAGAFPSVTMSWMQTAPQPWAIGAVSLKQAPRFAPFDFDGDKKSDVSVWQDDTTNNWIVQRSSDGQLQTHIDWGSSALGDVAIPGDYDGDGKTDFAVYRSGEGNWYIIRSSDGSVLVKGWGGLAGDVPVPGDYDGDGMTDIAIWRSSEGNWYILNSSNNTVTLRSWGAGSLNDRPAQADYDGDGKTDIAVWRPSEGNWYIINSSTNTVTLKAWGAGSLNDKLVPADYDGDGRADIAVWRGSEGNWYIINSSDNSITVKGWGASSLGDVPVPADYDGDGRADIAVWRPSEGNWYILNSCGNSVSLRNLGQSQDTPAPFANVH